MFSEFQNTFASWTKTPEWIRTDFQKEILRVRGNISSSDHYSSTARALLEEEAELSLFLNNQTGSFHELKRYERKQEHKESNHSFQASTHYATPAAHPVSPPQLSPIPNHYRKSLIRKGLEKWMEFNVKLKLRRKNALELFIWKRVQSTQDSIFNADHNNEEDMSLNQYNNRSYRRTMQSFTPSLLCVRETTIFRSRLSSILLNDIYFTKIPLMKMTTYAIS
jgi:hypothetical protein